MNLFEIIKVYEADSSLRIISKQKTVVIHKCNGYVPDQIAEWVCENVSCSIVRLYCDFTNPHDLNEIKKKLDSNKQFDLVTVDFYEFPIKDRLWSQGLWKKAEYVHFNCPVYVFKASMGSYEQTLRENGVKVKNLGTHNKTCEFFYEGKYYYACQNRTDLFIMEKECRLDDPLGYDWNELVLDCVGQGNGKPFMNLPLLIA